MDRIELLKSLVPHLEELDAAVGFSAVMIVDEMHRILDKYDAQVIFNYEQKIEEKRKKS